MSHGPVQATFEQMGTPLSEVTFVVVDLETTGGPPGPGSITEIGAVRVRGGAVDAEFSTLVNPGTAIPAQITVLTGITNAMVAGAPSVHRAVDSFLDWARLERQDTVLVAHNARFDVAHLRQAARSHDLAWGSPTVLDTLALARKAWSRADVPNHRLGTLATFVGSPTRPTHRALDDARATVDVLHAVLEVMAPLGVTHLEDLATAADPVPARRRAKTSLADGLQAGCGVYQFLSPTGQVLYVGSAVNLRRRVRSYFTAAEKRRHVARMLDIASEVRAVPTATLIEARVRELRMIAELDPPANRRSRSPRRQPWLRLVTGPGSQAHLGATTVLPTDQVRQAVGPFPSCSAAAQAERAAEAVLRLRSWDGSGRRELAAGDRPADLDTAREVLAGRIDLVVDRLMERVADLAAQERYEEAGTWTERLRSLVLGARRAEAVRPLLTCPHLVAARRRTGGGWELVVVRWGRLAGSATTEPGQDPRPAVATLTATAQVVAEPRIVGEAASVEETLLLADWVLDEGARIVELDPQAPPLTWPLTSASRYRRIIDSREPRERDR